jgi:GNAT superfamily N-acetyltransferase
MVAELGESAVGRRPSGELVGVLTWHPGGDGDDTVELSAVAAAEPGRGIGTALLAAFLEAIRGSGARRVWLATTNDNLDALAFYQRRGFRLAELRPGAVDAARRLKPTIPAVGAHGIPMRDELELVLDLDPD